MRKVIPDLRAAIQRAAAEIPGVATRNPETAAKLLAEAQALEEKKRLPQAKKKYAAAFEADPLSYPVALGYARLLKRTETSAEGVDKALLAYRAVIDQRPAVQKNSLEAARLAYANRRWATAVRIMDRAVAHDPLNKESIDVLIGALMKAGNDKLAKAWGEYRKDLGR
jgi:tetratricopeptide (TPR) repeat protein